MKSGVARYKSTDRCFLMVHKYASQDPIKPTNNEGKSPISDPAAGIMPRPLGSVLGKPSIGGNIAEACIKSIVPPMKEPSVTTTNVTIERAMRRPVTTVALLT
jgi:hypothetical protein